MRTIGHRASTRAQHAGEALDDRDGDGDDGDGDDGDGDDGDAQASTPSASSTPSTPSAPSAPAPARAQRDDASAEALSRDLKERLAIAQEDARNDRYTFGD